MTPEQYLTEAKAYYASGRFLEAAAAASIAAAATSMATLKASEPPAIHPGNHEPQPREWCRQCDRPNHRKIKGQPCPRCDTSRLRVHPCRHCGVNLERRQTDPGDSASHWHWLDAGNRRDCSQAPDPALPVPDPAEVEEDVSPDQLWASFLHLWHNVGSNRGPLTAEEIVHDVDFKAQIPRTRFGELPHPKHLDAWLIARRGKNYRDFTVELVKVDNGVNRWQLQMVS